MWITVVWILIWILVFMILVILHEFWHFMAARKCWMKVPEFWIGLPPKLCNLRKDKQWTQYTLNRIPLGWFCQIEWEDPTDKKSFENPNTLFTAKLWKRLIVIFAWVTMNFLTAIVILTWLFRYGTKPLSITQVAEDKWSTSYLMASSSFLREKWFLTWQVESWVLIQSVNEWWLWDEIWLEAWDVIETFDGQYLNFTNFLSLMASWANASHEFGVHKKNWDSDVIVFECKWECKFDIIISENWNIEINDIKFWLGWAILAAFHEIWAEWKLTMNILWDFWRSIATFKKTEMKSALNSLSWPVWVVKVFEEMFKIWNFIDILSLMAVISIALWIFNVLPIPALDWGRAVWMILQSTFKVKPEKYFKYEWYVNMVFFYLLLLLWVIIIIKDLVVMRWVNIPFIS